MSRKPYFRKFDGWWYAQIRQGAKRKQIKLVKGLENQQEAYRVFCRIMAEEEGEVPQPVALTVATLCDLFLETIQKSIMKTTFVDYRYYLRDFCHSHGRKMVVDIKPFHVSKWLDSHPNWKSSRANAIEALKRPFSWGTAEGLLIRNPIQSIKKPERGRRDRVLSTEEQKQILETIHDKDFRDFVFALQQTGCRPSEVARVSAADVNLELGIWTFIKHKTARKTQRSRFIYLTPPMIDLTRKLMDRYPDGPLFRSPWGKGRFYSKEIIVQRFRSIRRKLPFMKHFTAYTFRHSYATHALMNGVGLAHVAELMGHTSIAMVMRHYGHLMGQVAHMQEAARKAVERKEDGGTEPKQPSK